MEARALVATLQVPGNVRLLQWVRRPADAADAAHWRDRGCRVSARGGFRYRLRVDQ